MLRRATVFRSMAEERFNRGDFELWRDGKAFPRYLLVPEITLTTRYLFLEDSGLSNFFDSWQQTLAITILRTGSRSNIHPNFDERSEVLTHALYPYLSKEEHIGCHQHAQPLISLTLPKPFCHLQNDPHEGWLLRQRRQPYQD